MKNQIKKYRGYLITFFLTTIFLLLLFKILGIFEGSLVISDLKSQYYPFLMQVRRWLTREIELYNFNMGMGDSFLGTFYYYMSSPFNILTLFIRDINILAITLVVLKLSFSSIFCYKYLKYQFKEEKIVYLTIFSLLYAISSFSLSYYMHIEFLDIYMLFPLLLLGIDKKVKEGKNFQYIIILLLIIFCNYYLAYMVCIFSFIYFNYRCLINKVTFKELLRKEIDFIIIIFLTCLTASIVLLPIITEIGSYSRQNGMLFGGEKIKLGFNFFDVVRHYIVGDLSSITIQNANNYYIYTSIIIIPLVYFYYINKDIPKREKILTTIILLILVLSIGCNYINYMWHGFAPTNFINGRYTFMFILFILMISIKSIYNIKEYKLYHYIISFFIVLIPVIIYIIMMKSIKIPIDYIIKVVLVFIFILILKLIPDIKKLNLLLTILLIIELGWNSYTCLNRFKYNLKLNNDDYQECIEYIKNKENTKFYRIEDNIVETENYATLYNYYGIDYFMSTIKKDLVDFFINLNVGDHGKTKNGISYDGSYNLISSLLNVKYYIETLNINNDVYKKISDIGKYAIYENEESLELGYMVDEKILETKLDDNGLENINNIYRNMTNTDKNVVEKAEVKKESNELYSFTNTNNRDFYVLVDLKGWEQYYQSLKVSINDELLANTNNTYLYKVKNNYKENELLNIQISANEQTFNDIIGVYVYYYNDDIYKECIDKLKRNQLEVTNIINNQLEGIISVDEENILFTSIPYNSDLDIYVDGVKTEKIKLLNTFIGIRLDKGEHRIMIKYRPKMLYISIIPSLCGLMLLCIYINKSKIINRRDKFI